MNCTSSIDRADMGARPALEQPPAGLDAQVRKRLRAVKYLVAAATETDAMERSGLRRRAAKLILPRRQSYRLVQPGDTVSSHG